MTAIVVHSLPHRLRISVPRLKHDRRSAAELRSRLRMLPGVVAASANPMTGSVLVEHDALAGTRERILRSLAEAGHHVRFPATVTAGRPDPRTQVAELLAQALLERCIERALRAAVAAVI